MERKKRDNSWRSYTLTHTVCGSQRRNCGMNKNHYNVCTTKCTPVNPYDGDDGNNDGVNDDDDKETEKSTHKQ